MEKPRRPRNAFVGGMTNLAVIAGYARQIDTEDGKVIGLTVQQTNNINTSLPVFYESRRRRPGGSLRDQSRIKVTGHIFGRQLESGVRVAEFSVLSRERPDIFDLPGMGCWTKRVPDGGVQPDLPAPPANEDGAGIEAQASEDADGVDDVVREMAEVFRPFDGYTDDERPPLNIVQVAGIAYAAMMAKDKDGRMAADCAEVLICQHADPARAIPIRVYGKKAAYVAKKVVRGMPIIVVGQFRVRVVVVAKGEDGAPDKVERYPYIHASSVDVAEPKDIEVMPDWAAAQIEEIAKARRRDLDERKQRVASKAAVRKPAPAAPAQGEKVRQAGKPNGAAAGGDLLATSLSRALGS